MRHTPAYATRYAMLTYVALYDVLMPHAADADYFFSPRADVAVYLLPRRCFSRFRFYAMLSLMMQPLSTAMVITSYAFTPCRSYLRLLDVFAIFRRCSFFFTLPLCRLLP